jgi:hypothetical protein
MEAAIMMRIVVFPSILSLTVIMPPLARSQSERH